MSPTLRFVVRYGFALTLLGSTLPGCTGSSSRHQDTTPAPLVTEGKDERRVEPEVKGESDRSAKPAEAEAPPTPELAFPDEPFRAKQPEAGKPRPFRMPRMQRFKLPSGIDVYLVEQHDLPIISIDLDFDGGALLDPPGKEGLASVCTDMMTEGTKDLEKLAFEEALGDIASRVSSYSGDDSMGISMSTLSKHFGDTFALFRASLLEPGMRTEELDRLIKRRLQALKQAKAVPQSVALRVSNPVMYGPAHARGRVVTEASYQSITIDDCKSFHQRQIKPKGARLFIVGDMTEKQVREHFGQPLASFTGAAPVLPRKAAPASMDGSVFFVDVPGAAQSSVYVMHFGPQRKAGDYFSNYMMAAILGGGFSSRINMNLRENKGYSYGARGSFRYTRDDGLFYMSSSVRSDTTYQTVLEMMDELEALKSGKRPATKDELDREKNGAILGLPAEFATARAALSKYREIVYHGLPLDYYNGYVGKLGKVNLGQVMQSAKKHLKPEAVRIVIVGDGSAPLIHRVDGKDQPFAKDGTPVTLRDGLSQLVAGGRLGAKASLVVLDADGKPVAK